MNTTAAAPAAADRESVIDRVKKLLALAGNNTNVNEAAIAMARAQRLMLEHKLAIAELLVEGSVQEEVGGINVDEPGEFVLAWRSILFEVLARSSCCQVIRWGVEDATGRKATRFHVIGTEGDATFASYCYRYLVSEIDRLAANECRGRGFGYSNAFRRGAVDAIGARLKQTRQEIAASTSTALVVLRKADEAVTDYVHRRFKGLIVKRRAARPSHERGFARGQVAGARIPIPGKDRRPGLGAEPRKLGA